MEYMEIKRFDRQTVGYIEIDAAGNKTVRDFYHRILGYYDKSGNVTMNFYRQIIAFGDVTGIFFKDLIRI